MNQNPKEDATPTTTVALSDIDRVTKLFELGIASKEQVQALLRELIPTTSSVPNRAPEFRIRSKHRSKFANANTAESISDTNDSLMNNAKPPSKRKKTESTQSKTTLLSTPPNKKTKKQRRPKRSSPNTSNMRKMAKNPARRRFFAQCMLLESLLWRKQKGKKKAEMDELLFKRAAKSSVNEMYAENPGDLASVARKTLRAAVKWQVRLFFLHTIVC